MAVHPLPWLGPEEYLRIESESPFRHEYSGGSSEVGFDFTSQAPHSIA
jgi:hypothetical protein